jgi:hypothetical protein
MALFQSLGIAALLVFMSSNHASYGIMASKPSFRILPGTPSGPTDLFFLIAASRFLIILMLMVKGSPELVCFNFKKFQQDDTVQYFIISCQSLYMFREYPMPIIRSSINCTHSIWGRKTVTDKTVILAYCSAN